MVLQASHPLVIGLLINMHVQKPNISAVGQVHSISDSKDVKSFRHQSRREPRLNRVLDNSPPAL
jgi:hypothetical protein